MQIDWLTVTAQAVNFLVLVLLLHHFLYGPIVRAMDRRQNDIASRYEDVRQRKEAAEQEEACYREKLRDLEDAKGQRLAALQAEIDQERAALLEKARSEVEQLSRSWKAEVGREKSSFLKRARRELVHQSVALTRTALRDLAGHDLEERMAMRLIDRIRDLPEDDTRALARSRNRRVQVRSSHDIPETLRHRITAVLQEAVAADLLVAFQTSPSIGCGIALVAEGCRLEWSLAAYLDDFEEALNAALRLEGETGEHA